MATPSQDEAMSSSTRGKPTKNTLEDNIVPLDAVSAVKRKKEPPPESVEEIKIRSLVIVSFWAIVLFLGLPIWWRTTAIYRARLPLNQMMDWADGRVRSSNVSLDILTDRRLVDQYFHSKYQSMLVRYSSRRHSTFSEPHNMHWMTSTTSRDIIYDYSCHRRQMRRLRSSGSQPVLQIWMKRWHW